MTRLEWWVVQVGKGDGFIFMQWLEVNQGFYSGQLGQKSKCYRTGTNTKSWAKTFDLSKCDLLSFVCCIATPRLHTPSRHVSAKETNEKRCISDRCNSHKHIKRTATLTTEGKGNYIQHYAHCHMIT